MKMGYNSILVKVSVGNLPSNYPELYNIPGPDEEKEYYF
jgi:hypothetical protein